MSCEVEPVKKEDKLQRWDLGARIVIVKYVNCIAGRLLHFQHFCVVTMITVDHFFHLCFFVAKPQKKQV